jgi:hypothetical protein
MKAFWDIVTCCLVEVDRRFGGAYCLHHQGLHRPVLHTQSFAFFFRIWKGKTTESLTTKQLVKPIEESL